MSTPGSGISILGTIAGTIAQSGDISAGILQVQAIAAKPTDPMGPSPIEFGVNSAKVANSIIDIAGKSAKAVPYVGALLGVGSLGLNIDKARVW